jgi:hypothetical protein
MFKSFCTISFALALFFTQVAHALPQAAAPTPSPLRAAFDGTFDNPTYSVGNVACSNGANGLAAKYPTFNKIPNYPYVGGAFDVAWNSPNCGGCWSITNPANGASIYMTAVDSAGHGFNLGTAAFNALNGGQKNTINVVATKVPRYWCGL